MDKREKYLIKNTTKAEREMIVKRALGGDDGCAGCAGCDGLSCPDGYEMYKPYIDGKEELFEINAKIRGGTVF